MKKMVILIGLLVLSVLVVGCTQGGTLAGQASGPTLLAGETRCDGRDDNRNRLIDEGCDDDGDKYCDSSMNLVGTPRVCPNGGGDCQDTNSAFHPGATDECAPTYADYNCDNILSCAPTTECPPVGLRCDNILTLLEGETIRTTAQDNNGIRGEHDLMIALINSTSTRLNVDSIPETIHNRQSAMVNNVVITAWYVLYQDYAGGVHSVTLCVGE